MTFFSTGKAVGKLNKTTSKLSAVLTPVYIHTRQIPMVSILSPRGNNGRRRRRL